MRIECRHQEHRKAPSHDVVVSPDGVVSTPHDLEAERVAVAFGGYSSCLILVEKTVPAFLSEIWPILTRSMIALGMTPSGKVRVAEHLQTGCCWRKDFPDATRAFEHLSSADHHATRHEVPYWQVLRLIRAAPAGWGDPDGVPWHDPALAARVDHVASMTELWRRGLHPHVVEEAASVAAAVELPLPTAYFVEMAYGDVDREWFVEMLAHRPDPATALWLARHPQLAKRPAGRDVGFWLGLGLRFIDVEEAVTSGLDADQVHAAAAELGEPLRRTAGHLLAWARIGILPTPVHLAAMRRLGLVLPTPVGPALERLVRDANGHPRLVERGPFDRTDLGVMLAILGNRQEVIAALLAGVNDIHDLVSHVLPFNPQPQESPA